MYIKILIVSSILVLFSSCDNLNQPGELEYKNSVFFNLSVNSKKQEVYIYHVLLKDNEDKIKFDSRQYKYYPSLININAKIEILNSLMKFNNFGVVEEVPSWDAAAKRKFYTNVDNLYLLPEEKYLLNIKIDDLIITGETKTPGDFSFINFAEKEYVKVKSDSQFTIKWNRSSDAMIYEANIYVSEKTNYYSNVNILYQQQKNILNSSREFKFIFNQNYDTLRVAVFAFDKNYYDFKNSGITKSGIKGAYGYFCSSVKKEIIFINQK